MLSDHSNVLLVNTFFYFLLFCIFFFFFWHFVSLVCCIFHALTPLRKKKEKTTQFCPCCCDYSLGLPVVTTGYWGHMSRAPLRCALRSRNCRKSKLLCPLGIRPCVVVLAGEPAFWWLLVGVCPLAFVQAAPAW